MKCSLNPRVVSSSDPNVIKAVRMKEPHLPDLEKIESIVILRLNEDGRCTRAGKEARSAKRDCRLAEYDTELLDALPRRFVKA